MFLVVCILSVSVSCILSAELPCFPSEIKETRVLFCLCLGHLSAWYGHGCCMHPTFENSLVLNPSHTWRNLWSQADLPTEQLCVFRLGCLLQHIFVKHQRNHSMLLLESTTAVAFSLLFILSVLQLFEQALVIDNSGGPASSHIMCLN